MGKQICVVIVAFFIFSACGLLNGTPEPTRVVLAFEAAALINPTSEGQSSPLVVRIYHLRSISEFENSDFFSLYKRDEELLGNDMLNKETIIVKPREKQTIQQRVSNETKAVGLLGAFRNYEEAQWKGLVTVSPNQTNVVNIQIRGNGLVVER